MFYVSKIEGKGKKTQVFVTDTADGVTEPISLQDAEDLMNRGIRIEGVYRHYERNDYKRPTNRAVVSYRGSFTDLMHFPIGEPVLLDRADFSNDFGIFLGHALLEEQGDKGINQVYGVLIYSTDDLSRFYHASQTSVENLYFLSCRYLIRLSPLSVVIRKCVSSATNVMRMQKCLREAGGLSILSQDIFISRKDKKERVRPGV